jgi:hypothetical protein
VTRGLTSISSESHEDLIVLTELKPGRTPVIDLENEEPPQGANVARPTEWTNHDVHDTVCSFVGLLFLPATVTFLTADALITGVLDGVDS